VGASDQGKGGVSLPLAFKLKGTRIPLRHGRLALPPHGV